MVKELEAAFAGGVRLRLFAEFIAYAVAIASRRARVRGEKTAHYIVNGKLRREPKKVSKAWLKVLDRSLDIMMKESVFGSLYAAWYRLNGQGSAWTFSGSLIPQDLKTPPSSADEYVPRDMKALFDVGYKWGLKNEWHPGLPLPDYDHQ